MERKLKPRKPRNWVAVDAHFRSNAGAVGKTNKAQHKKDRRDSKINLKKGVGQDE